MLGVSEGYFGADFIGDFTHDMEGELLLSSGQVQVWFSLQSRFNYFELDSEVGRLVRFYEVSESNPYFNRKKYSTCLHLSFTQEL